MLTRDAGLRGTSALWLGVPLIGLMVVSTVGCPPGDDKSGSFTKRLAPDSVSTDGCTWSWTVVESDLVEPSPDNDVRITVVEFSLRHDGNWPTRVTVAGPIGTRRPREGSHTDESWNTRWAGDDVSELLDRSVSPHGYEGVYLLTVDERTLLEAGCSGLEGVTLTLEGSSR